MRAKIVIDAEEQRHLVAQLQTKIDPQSKRIQRYLGMPDLSRTPGSPILELAEKIISLPRFKDFDVIEVPEIVPADISFDLFDFPADHPARSASDTYYVDDKHILRTHTTVMWYYYLMDHGIKQQIKDNK